MVKVSETFFVPAQEALNLCVKEEARYKGQKICSYGWIAKNVPYY
jgi:hypothetical protein